MRVCERKIEREHGKIINGLTLEEEGGGEHLSARDRVQCTLDLLCQRMSILADWTSSIYMHAHA
jgi:hypothetical protein